MTDAGTADESASPSDESASPSDEATSAPDESAGQSGADDAYRGLPGAFLYAARVTDSRLFRSYVVVATLLTLFVSLLFGLGVLQLVVGVGGGSGVFNLSRAFFVLVALGVLAPVLAPVLLVARRHRRGGTGDGDGGRGDGTGVADRSHHGYDRRMGLAGYLVVASLYVGLVATVPPAQQEPVSGALAPVVETLYALPPAAGLVPPLVAAGVVALLARRG